MRGGRLRLGVNIDHVATVRNARGSAWPDPLRAAILAETAGADGITAHLREDRRHIRDADMEALAAGIGIPLNFECAATDEMQAILLRLLGYYITIPLVEAYQKARAAKAKDRSERRMRLKAALAEAANRLKPRHDRDGEDGRGG